jgi:fibronectin type 3 domain-containing protein/TolB-like protein
MESFRRQGKGVLLFLVVFAIAVVSSASGAKFPSSLPPALQRLTIDHSDDLDTNRFAQGQSHFRIAVFTFNILNLGAAGYDATLSNLFMTLLDRHPNFEVMSRKDLEESLRRAGLQQSEKTSVVQTVGVRLGLDGIVLGNVKKAGSSLEFEVKFVETSRGETLLHRHEQMFGSASLRQKVEEITSEIVQIADQYQPSPVIVQKEEVSSCPAQPGGLQARGGSRKVVLSWQPNRESNLRGYKIYRGTTPTGPFSKVASVTKNTFTDADLENDRTYYYKVQAFSKEGKESPASTVIAAETAPSPLNPIILDATSLIASIRIRWATNPRKGDEGTEVSGFKIYRATNPVGEYVWVDSVSVDSENPRVPSLKQFEYKDPSALRLKQFEYEDTGLADGTKYYYRLTAFNNKGIESDFSSTLEGSTVSRPAGLQAIGDMIREIHLQWHPTPFAEVKGYRLYRNTSAEGTFELIGELDSPRKDSYVDKQNLDDAVTYYYKLTVYDKEGRETGLSEIASTTTRGKPPTPEGLAAQSGLVKEVKLAWKIRPEEEVEGYYIFRNTAESGEFREIGRVKGREKTAFLDEGDRSRPLDDNTTYYYMITSYNKVDVNSDPCSIVSATTKPRPSPPTGLSAQGGLPAKIVLAWNPNPETDIKYYHLQRKLSGEEFKEVEKLPTDETLYEDVKLDHGITYAYRLRAQDKDNLLSDFSNTVEATTKPLPKSPAGIEVIPLAHGFKLKWKPNPEMDVVTYKIYLRSFFRDKEIGSTGELEFTTESLKPDDEYSVSVTAVDKDGLESEKSEPITVRTLGQ